MVDFSELTRSELIEKLEMAKRSDAPYEVKKQYIDSLYYYLDKPSNEEILQQIEEGQADLDDIQ